MYLYATKRFLIHLTWCIVTVGLVACGGSDSPSDTAEATRITLYDPQADTTGRELPLGTDTTWPTNESLQSFLGSLEAGGGEAYLLYDHSNQGQRLNVILEPDPNLVEVTADGTRFVDIDLQIGGYTVRVADAPITNSPYPVLIARDINPATVEVLKTYERPRQADGSLGNPKLSMVSVFQRDKASEGPIASIEGDVIIPTPPDYDCDEEAWKIAGEVPPIAVKFPPINNCAAQECAYVKAAYIRAVHDVWRIRQMLDFIDSKGNDEIRSFLWKQPAAGPNGEKLSSITSLAYYFGEYSRNRFDAIRWTFNQLAADLKDHNLDGADLDLQCHPPRAIDICNTTDDVPAHHAVKSNIKICSEFFEMSENYMALILVHEPLHHVFVPWKKNGFPSLDPIKDTHTHGHGTLCAAKVKTEKMYGIDRVRHLASYTRKSQNNKDCFHRNFALLNNDTYSYAANTIGRMVRSGEIKYWPYKESHTPPVYGGCDGTPPPTNPQDWDDPLSKCQKINTELVCPNGGGGGVHIPSLDIAMNCPPDTN